MIVIALAGSWLCRETAAIMALSAPAQTYGGFLMGLGLPLPVVQIAPGWSSMLSLWLVFVALGYCGWRASHEIDGSVNRGVAWVLCGYAAVGLTLTFFSVTHSIDEYYYTAFARIFGVYGIDPYILVKPLQLNDDVLTRNLIPLGNPPFPDPYGPGFTLLAGIVGRLESRTNLLTQLWTWRVIAVASCVGIAAALAFMLKGVAPGERARRVATFAFHPLTLYESGVGGHNDVLMMLPAVWAFALVDDLPLIAGLLVGTAVAIKYLAVVLVPFLALRALRKSRSGAALLTVLAVLVPVLCFYPFAFGTTGRTTLVRVGSSLSMSLNWLLALPLFAAHAGEALIRTLQAVIVAAFAALFVIAVARYRRTFASGEMYRAIVALLWALPALHPWYAMWVTPIAASRGAWASYAWWFAALSLLAYGHEAVLPTPFNHAVFVSLAIIVLAVPVIIARRARPQNGLANEQTH